MNERVDAATALGFAYWYQIYLETYRLGDAIRKEELVAAIRDDFKPERAEYLRLGMSAINRLQAMEYSVVRRSDA